MAIPKFKQFYQLMFDQNEKTFRAFKPIHDEYQAAKAEGVPSEELTNKFHDEGRRVLDIARDWERRLCSGMERGKFAQYSSQLSEKFWDEVRDYLPLVDEIGVKTSFTKPTKD